MLYGEIDGKLFVNTIFIQPTNKCARNCPGCYAKLHHHKGPQLPAEELLKFQKMVYWSEHIHANQITVSVDSPRYDVTDWRLEPRDTELMDAARFILYTGAPQCFPFQTNPQLHATVNSVADFKKYGVTIRPNLDTITFSNVNILSGDPAEIKNLQSMGIKVNYNYSLPITKLNEKSWADFSQHKDLIFNLVDSIYLLLWKEPVGKSYDLFEYGKYKERIHNQLEWADKIVREYSDKKIQLDTCIEACREYKKTGSGCSCNVSRFQVWPDGSVSGCPYALDSNTEPATTAEKVVYNIRTARKSYDWDKCVLKGMI